MIAKCPILQNFESIILFKVNYNEKINISIPEPSLFFYDISQ